MLAKDGERVPFHLLFHMTGAVETWLTRLASNGIVLVEIGGHYCGWKWSRWWWVLCKLAGNASTTKNEMW